MTPEEYKDQALRTESTEHPNLCTCEARVLHGVLGLADETGELAKAVKAHLYYDHPLDKTNLAEELGDVLWYINLILDAAGLGMGEVMEANIAKLCARYPDEFASDLASETNRDRKAEREAMKNQLDRGGPGCTT